MRTAYAQVAIPREAELADGARVELRERAEALLAVRAARREPLARLGIGRDDPCRIDGGGGRRREGVGRNGCIASAAAGCERGREKHESGNSLHLGRHQLGGYGTEILLDWG